MRASPPSSVASASRPLLFNLDALLQDTLMATPKYLRLYSIPVLDYRSSSQAAAVSIAQPPRFPTLG